MTPQRIRLQRTKGWRKPEGAIIVARPSRWGNPFTVANIQAENCNSLSDRTARAVAVERFRELAEQDSPTGIPVYPMLSAIQRELRGKDLACWCPLDQPCHADVLLEMANKDVGAPR